MSVSGITETALYLSFILEDETFAIDVSSVREVLDLSKITKVPRTPDFMRGVINIRGSVVPVIDMRRKFGMPKTESTVNTRIIVMEIVTDAQTIVLGAVADSVNDVLELEPDGIEPTPEIGSNWKTEFIKGIGKRDNTFIMILDIGLVFSSEELESVDEAGKSMPPASTEEPEAEAAGAPA